MLSQNVEKIKVALTGLFLVCILLPLNAAAAIFFYGTGQTVIGHIQKSAAKDGNSLIEMAREFDLGYNEIADANPALDPFVPGENADVLLPTSWILPNVESHSGIVVNISGQAVSPKSP